MIIYVHFAKFASAKSLTFINLSALINHIWTFTQMDWPMLDSHGHKSAHFIAIICSYMLILML